MFLMLLLEDNDDDDSDADSVTGCVVVLWSLLFRLARLARATAEVFTLDTPRNAAGGRGSRE